MRKFTKAERGTFKYWFAHWGAFQMIALLCRAWKPKYLLHDIEKPWLKLLWGDYIKVQTYHRTHSSHHLEYKGKKKDYIGMVIDWECSRYTKEAEPLNAQETLDDYYKKHVIDSQEYFKIQKTIKELDL